MIRVGVREVGFVWAMAWLTVVGCTNKVPVDRTDTGNGSGSRSGPGAEPPAGATEDADGDGFAVGDGDCDDHDADVHPDATEWCDEIDNNCDGEIDEITAEDAALWYEDGDSDGYGNPAVREWGCTGPAGWVLKGGDCDDAQAEISPAADERCDEIDNDCNGETDEEGAVDGVIVYRDADSDGHGSQDAPVRLCTWGTGYSASDQDCDDLRDDVSPDADEYCDGVDNDCDGVVDEPDAVDADWAFEDLDGDGFGNSDVRVIGCVLAPDVSGVGRDCNDEDATIYPGADEYCDGLDNDCDVRVDEGTPVDATRFYWDGDLDGYGSEASSYLACAPIWGAGVTVGGDCDDYRADVNPDASEVCDGVDNDCDGEVEIDGDGVCSIWRYDLDAGAWTAMGLDPEGSVHAPSSEIEAALSIIDRHEIWVLTHTSFHVMNLSTGGWTNHGVREARFPVLDGMTVTGGYVVRSAFHRVGEAGVYLSTEDTAWMFDLSVATGAIEFAEAHDFDANPDWAHVLAPDPEDVGAMWIDLGDAPGWATEDLGDVCGIDIWDTKFYIGMLASDHMHLYETGYCFAFSGRHDVDGWGPFDEAGSPPTELVVGAGMTNDALYMFVR